MCTARADVSGQHVMALNLSRLRGMPILLEVDVVVDTEALPNTIQMTAQPIGVDGTRLDVCQSEPDAGMDCGLPIETEPAVLAENGLFELSFGEVTINGAANPVFGEDVTLDLTLFGEIRADHTICGRMVGTLLAPAESALDGSTFALIRFEGDDFDGIRPPLGCGTCPGEMAAESPDVWPRSGLRCPS